MQRNRFILFQLLYSAVLLPQGIAAEEEISLADDTLQVTEDLHESKEWQAVAQRLIELCETTPAPPSLSTLCQIEMAVRSYADLPPYAREQDSVKLTYQKLHRWLYPPVLLSWTERVVPMLQGNKTTLILAFVGIVILLGSLGRISEVPQLSLRGRLERITYYYHTLLFVYAIAFIFWAGWQLREPEYKSWYTHPAEKIFVPARWAWATQHFPHLVAGYQRTPPYHSSLFWSSLVLLFAFHTAALPFVFTHHRRELFSGVGEDPPLSWPKILYSSTLFTFLFTVAVRTLSRGSSFFDKEQLYNLKHIEQAGLAEWEVAELLNGMNDFWTFVYHTAHPMGAQLYVGNLLRLSFPLAGDLSLLQLQRAVHSFFILEESIYLPFLFKERTLSVYSQFTAKLHLLLEGSLSKENVKECILLLRLLHGLVEEERGFER